MVGGLKSRVCRSSPVWLPEPALVIDTDSDTDGEYRKKEHRKSGSVSGFGIEKQAARTGRHTGLPLQFKLFTRYRSLVTITSKAVIVIENSRSR